MAAAIFKVDTNVAAQTLSKAISGGQTLCLADDGKTITLDSDSVTFTPMQSPLTILLSVESLENVDFGSDSAI